MEMMQSKLAAVAALIAVAQAQVMAYCDRRKAPDWEECDAIRWAHGIEFANGDKLPEAATGNPEDCQSFCRSWSGSLCSIGWCYRQSCHEVTGDAFRDVSTHYDIVRTYCYADAPGSGGADGMEGGNAPADQNWGTYVWHNFNNDWPPPMARKTLSDGVVEETWTFEDFQAHLNESARIGAEKRAQEENSTKTRENKQKRQDSVTIISNRYMVRRPGERYQASNILSSGIEEGWAFTESLSIGVQVSVGVSASFFSLFTAEASITTTFEHTESVSKTETFTVGDCPGDAIMYWVPLFDYYWVQDGNGDQHDIWIPLGAGGNALGEWDTDCLGTGTQV